MRAATAGRHARRRLRRRTGFILLEVVLALLLLVGASAVVVGGLQSAARSVERLELEARAADLACTALTRLQVGLAAPRARAPEGLAGAEGFTLEVVLGPVVGEDGEAIAPEGDAAEPADAPGDFALKRVEVVVRHGAARLTVRRTQDVLFRRAPNETDLSRGELDAELTEPAPGEPTAQPSRDFPRRESRDSPRGASAPAAERREAPRRGAFGHSQEGGYGGR